MLRGRCPRLVCPTPSGSTYRHPFIEYEWQLPSLVKPVPMAIGSRRQRRDIADSGNCDNKNALATRRKNRIEISPLHSASVEMENNEITTDAPKLFRKIKKGNFNGNIELQIYEIGRILKNIFCPTSKFTNDEKIPHFWRQKVKVKIMSL